MVLEGLRIVLRPAKPRDLLKMMEWDQDDEVTRYIGKKFDSFKTCEDWFMEALSDPLHRVLSIDTKDGRFIGSVELDHISRKNGTAELAIVIGEREYWDRGFGTETITLTLFFAFTRVHLSRVYLRVYASNQRAIRCYEKCGFHKEGIMRPSARLVRREGPVILMSIEADHFLSSYFGDAPAASATGAVSASGSSPAASGTTVAGGAASQGPPGGTRRGPSRG